LSNDTNAPEGAGWLVLKHVSWRYRWKIEIGCGNAEEGSGVSTRDRGSVEAGKLSKFFLWVREVSCSSLWKAV
jgi:hypothetical protein